MSVIIASNAFMSLVRTYHRNLPLREILNVPPQSLLGVDVEAKQLLEKLGIKIVFDFVTSVNLRQRAKLVVGALFQRGMPTGDIVKRACVVGKKLGDLEFLSIEILGGIPTSDSSNIQMTLAIATVRALALYSPYREAASLLIAASFRRTRQVLTQRCPQTSCRNPTNFRLP